MILLELGGYDAAEETISQEYLTNPIKKAPSI